MKKGIMIVFAAVLVIGGAASVALAQPVSRAKACSTFQAVAVWNSTTSTYAMQCPGECTAPAVCEVEEATIIEGWSTAGCACVTRNGAGTITSSVVVVFSLAPCRVQLKQRSVPGGTEYGTRCTVVACKKSCVPKGPMALDSGKNVLSCACE